MPAVRMLPRLLHLAGRIQSTSMNEQAYRFVVIVKAVAIVTIARQEICNYA